MMPKKVGFELGKLNKGEILVEKYTSLIMGLVISILISMFFIVLPSEVILQIFWSAGYKNTDFWIEYLWKMALIPSFVIFPIWTYYLSKNKISSDELRFAGMKLSVSVTVLIGAQAIFIGGWGKIYDVSFAILLLPITSMYVSLLVKMVLNSFNIKECQVNERFEKMS